MDGSDLFRYYAQIDWNGLNQIIVYPIFHCVTIHKNNNTIYKIV